MRNDNPPSLRQAVLVTVPFYACPGEVFQTHIYDRIVRIHCPEDNIPGETILDIFVPPESFIQYKIQRIQENDSSDIRSYLVVVPKNVHPMDSFTIALPKDGKLVKVTCSSEWNPGIPLKITVPKIEDEQYIHYRVRVPNSVLPGQFFTVSIPCENGNQSIRASLKFPENCRPGQEIHFKFPKPPNLQ